MIKENKVSSYILYAAGEIVLVVIGILIALQINNWNEDRKAEQKERSLFGNLSIDFESRLEELKEINTARGDGIKAILELNHIIANMPSKPHDTVLDYTISRTVNGFKFNEEFKMLDVLFSTGLINDIKNEELKRKLIEWPQLVEEMLEEQRMHNTLLESEIRPFLASYVSLRAIYEKFDFRKYNIPKGEPVTLIKNYDGLLADPLFENYMAQEEVLLRINTMDTETLIASAEEIIELLNKK
jgi:hypothetical protein